MNYKKMRKHLKKITDEDTKELSWNDIDFDKFMDNIIEETKKQFGAMELIFACGQPWIFYKN